MRGKAHRKSCEYPDRAPSSPFSSAVPYRARPALDAGFARAGTHTKNPGSRFRRWHSTPPRSRAGRFCLPAPELRAVFAARRPWGYTPYALALLGTLLASAYGRDPGDCPRGLTVVPPGLSIHTGRGFFLQTEIGH